jgi:hypothetical protein
MMPLEVGKLYRCSEYFLSLFPNKETAATAANTAAVTNTAALAIADTVVGATATAAYWSRKLGKPVIYADKNIPLLVLNTEGEYVEVLAGDKVGWAICQDWLNIKEITDDAA